jgi:hypothetical protein
MYAHETIRPRFLVTRNTSPSQWERLPYLSVQLTLQLICLLFEEDLGLVVISVSTTYPCYLFILAADGVVKSILVSLVFHDNALTAIGNKFSDFLLPRNPRDWVNGRILGLQDFSIYRILLHARHTRAYQRQLFLQQLLFQLLQLMQL